MDEHEHDSDLARLANRLERERPVPAAAFRGDLRRQLINTRRATASPKRLWVWVSAYAGTGAALLLVAGLGVLGGGPFAP